MARYAWSADGGGGAAGVRKGSKRTTARFCLALQLHFRSEVCLLSCGLMGASPERPCDDMGGMDLLPCEAGGDAADFLHRPADQLAVLRLSDRIVFGGSGGRMLARWRMTAIIAKASITSET